MFTSCTIWERDTSLPVGSGNLSCMKQQDNQQEDREQGGKGSMEYKVFIRGADTFSTGKKLFHGKVLLFKNMKSR